VENLTSNDLFFRQEVLGENWDHGSSSHFWVIPPKRAQAHQQTSLSGSSFYKRSGSNFAHWVESRAKSPKYTKYSKIIITNNQKNLKKIQLF
jgi:dTDP-4-dehydrorhamnose 3,5-epimerase-like enzyme